MRLKSRGQVLVEFILSLGIVLLTLVGLSTLLWKEWMKLKCMKNLFEVTHRALVSNQKQNLHWDMELEKNDFEVIGKMKCHLGTEEVRLQFLEPNPPDL